MCATFLVQLLAGHLLVMFLAPSAIGGLCILIFTFVFDDRRQHPSAQPGVGTGFRRHFHVNPRRSSNFSWAFLSRFPAADGLRLPHHYQTYYLLQRLGSSEAEVPRQVYLGTLVQAGGIIVASLGGGSPTARVDARRSWWGWRSADSASACIWPWILPWSPTWCRPGTTARIWVCSTSPTPSRSRSRRLSRRSSWP